ncbi:MAG: hypothetical protein U1E65_27860 [Myxococcota bacterium]
MLDRLRGLFFSKRLAEPSVPTQHLVTPRRSTGVADAFVIVAEGMSLFAAANAQAAPELPAVGRALVAATAPTSSTAARDDARRTLWKSYVHGTQADYQTEKAWAESHGVQIPAGQVTVIGKRRGEGVSTKYQDEIVVFTKDARIERFLGTTRPSQLPRTDGGLVPDVDKNGTKDLGTPRPGIYRASGPWSYGVLGMNKPAFRVTDHGRDSLPAWRDLDGDGEFSPEERETSEHRGYRVGDVRIHYGFDADGTWTKDGLYSGPISVGCTNIQLEDLPRFIEAVGGTKASFTYAIVEDL